MVRRLMAALLVMMLTMTGGCARPRKTEQPTPGGTLVIGLLRFPTGVFRPLVSDERDAAPMTQMMYSGLLRLGPKLELVCDLCEDYAVSEDQRSINFRLRRNVTWHDGKPFTAADVVFTYQAMLAPEYTGAQTGKLASLMGVQVLLDDRDAIDRDLAAGKINQTEAAGRKTTAWKRWLDGPGKQAITAPDPYTVVFVTDAPYAPLLTAMLLPVAPAHTRGAVGTGPFKLVEFKKGELVRLVRHEAYHLGTPYLDEVVFRAVPAGKSAEMLQAGMLDYVPLSVAEVAALQDGQPVRLVETPSRGYQYLGVNQTRPIFEDRRVRQALMYGINRAGLVETLLQGRGAVVNTHGLPGHWAASEPAQLNNYPYDAGKAVALLTEAGWSTLDAQGYRLKNGKRLEFTLSYPKGNKAREASAPLIQRDLRSIGIKVNLQALAFAELTRDVFGQRQSDAWLLGWDVSIDPDPGPIYSPDNKWGLASGWTSARSEELLRQGRQTLSPAARQPLYSTWQALVNEELPCIFLYADHELAGVRTDRVHGLEPDVRGGLWNVWSLWIPKEKRNG